MGLRRRSSKAIKKQMKQVHDRLRNAKKNQKNHQKQVTKRKRELKQNPLNLPKKTPGDKTKPAESKRGHWRLLKKHQKHLEDATKEVASVKKELIGLQKELGEALAREAAQGDTGKKKRKALRRGLSKFKPMIVVFCVYNIYSVGVVEAAEEAGEDFFSEIKWVGDIIPSPPPPGRSIRRGRADHRW